MSFDDHWHSDEEPATGTRQITFLAERRLGNEETFELQSHVDRQFEGVQDVSADQSGEQSIISVQIRTAGSGDIDAVALAEELSTVVGVGMQVENDEVKQP